MSVAKPKPGEVTERKLTLGEGADLWKDADDRERDAKADKKKAAAVLKPHLLKTGKPYKGLRLKTTGGGWIFDGEKLKAFLGKRLREFQKQQAEGHTLERVP